MSVVTIKNLSFRTSLYLIAEVVKVKVEGGQTFHWFVEITMAMPSSEKSPYSRKRVRFGGPDEAHEALQDLVTAINELEETTAQPEEEEEEGEEDYDAVDEGTDVEE